MDLDRYRSQNLPTESDEPFQLGNSYTVDESSGGAEPVNALLNHGMSDVNGDYVPAADGSRNGSPREPHPQGSERR